MGTANYISPEQARGDIVDHRTDIWSLGVVLYEMLTGVSPFKADNWEAVLYSIFNKEPAPIKDIPDSLQSVVIKMLEKNPANRYRSMDDVIRELSVSGHPPSPETSKIIKIKDYMVDRGKRRIFIPVISFIVLAIILFFFSPILLDEVRASRKIPVAVMFFDNNTSDDSYNYLSQAIPNLLIASLEQSNYLSVMTWERIHDLLNIMGKKDKDIDEETAFALCRMDGREVVVLGSFTKTGSLFETDVKVIDVDSKEVLKTTSSKGEGVSSILNKQIDELSRDISEGAGLSERRIESMDKQITSITTSSMEAYNYFLRGREDAEKFYFDDARKFLERAVDIDSNFATAYLYLAPIYNWLGETKKMNEALNAASEYFIKYISTTNKYMNTLKKLGFPLFNSGIALAPFDVISDLLRGMRGSMLDMYRHPEELKKLASMFVEGQIKAGLQLAQLTPKIKVIFMPLHRGADGFMSDDQFEEFYWPGLTSVMEGFIKHNLIPGLFLEGSYNQRLKYLAEFAEKHKGKVLYGFDRTDLTKAKELFGDHACIKGNVPGSLLNAGTPQQVEDYVRKSIESCKDGGGFIIDGGVSGIPDEAKPENVKAMVDAAFKYGVYRK
ncbi:Serine/threonine-protein kinase PknD [subsurface metagenome]